ncbi:unnamed protein product [Rotaria socialis]|uniref:beta-glucosidase n=2 Tax=Rotaria socialis TaxID=392032 RepID=A0A820BJE5_9BILA|nr:unnamed protein product [Rotaria socialis]CAF3297715.1 unnamed protein product [Rotaria socialis]CAF3504321.1 unnamed protein product [Rotaria socialis]CAF4207184.1 unnamed protein product [Rotaria socialis]CAF4425691.1 unnamed protein product [Rotaria socialis]
MYKMSPLMFLLIFIANIHTILTAPPSLTSYDDKVNALLSKMTDEEKAGQMTQITINLILKDASKPWDQIEVDPAKLATAIQDYKVGSILNVAETGAYSLAKWHDIIEKVQDEAQRSRLQIPILYGIDSIHGANYIRDSVLFPQATGLAATFNTTLAHELGRIVAHQTRAAGITWNFHPQVDIGRQKLWPRLWETFGEDVKLVKDMGRAYTEGMQGDDLTSRESVAACLKHYVGYGLPLTGRDRTPAWIDERHMLEYFLPPFEESIRAGAVSVMINSGEVNGIPGHANYHLLTEVLKEKYQFHGFTVSDWEDIKRLHTREQTAATEKEAVRQAVMAGVDMSMVPFDFSFYNLTLECVKDGSIPRSRLDDAVRRILRVKYALGLFDGRNGWPDSSALATFNKPEYDETNLQAAREGITLLKNSGDILPLQNSAITTTNKVIVTGPTSNVLTSLNGGWSYTWQGNDESIYPQNLRSKTILESLRTRLGATRIEYYNSSSFDQLFDISDLLNAAPSASYIVVCLGEQAYTETPGNINDLTLDDAQLRLVEQIRNRTQIPIITVLVQGRPRIIRRIVDLSSAIIMMYLPGMEGGRALADILLGDYNPSGRLPITYPKYNHHLSTYDFKLAENRVGNFIDVEFEFGHGLSYTTFDYSNFNVAPTIEWNDQLTITLDVRNSGTRQGAHTVLLYVSDLYRTVTPPNKELKGYKKLSLEAGQQTQIQFTLRRDDLSFIGIDLTRQTEPGIFTVTVGSFATNFTLAAGQTPTNSVSAFMQVNHSYWIYFIHIFAFVMVKLI